LPSPEEREYAALLIGKARGDLHAAIALASGGVHEEAVGFHTASLALPQDRDKAKLVRADSQFVAYFRR
jgi:hypothetical protein